MRPAWSCWSSRTTGITGRCRGGILEHGEPPHEGCRREVSEELGLDIVPCRLLVVGWAGPDGVRPRPVVHFVFDGGELASDAPIQLQEDELDDYRFVASADAPECRRRGIRPRYGDDCLP